MCGPENADRAGDWLSVWLSRCASLQLRITSCERGVRTTPIARLGPAATMPGRLWARWRDVVDAFLGAPYRRLVKRRGKLKALVAVARNVPPPPGSCSPTPPPASTTSAPTTAAPARTSWPVPESRGRDGVTRFRGLSLTITRWGRSRGGWTTRIDALVGRVMRPVGLIVGPGHAGDKIRRWCRCSMTTPACTAAVHVLADNAYSHPSTRAQRRARRIPHTIPERGDDQDPAQSEGLPVVAGRPGLTSNAAERNTIERGFGRLK